MLIDLLRTPRRRIAAFFALYIAEGLPQGFVSVAIATRLRRQGVGPAEIGAFVAAFYLPWALKWAYAPVVDVFRSQRLGHRRAWILAMQLMMVATLLAITPLPLAGSLGLVTAILVLHSICAGIHDVAIDSMAVNVLDENSRGLANGTMFAGALLGHTAGGAGVLFMLGWGVSLEMAAAMVAAAILGVTLLVVLPMREAPAASAVATSMTTGLRGVRDRMHLFAGHAFRAFAGNRASFRGVMFALLPAGAMALGSPLDSNLAVEFGMSDSEFGSLKLWTQLLAVAAMVVGGWLSDRFGRRLTLAIYIVGTVVPVMWLAWVLFVHGYVMPGKPAAQAVPELIRALWLASLAYALCVGLMYGTRVAALMDVTDPRVAAMQFTAYTSMVNFAIAFTAGWNGLAVEAWGYPATLVVDALVGLLCLMFLPAMKPPTEFTDSRSGARARIAALTLGLACLSWLAYWPLRAHAGSAQPVIGSFYTLVFVASALFMLGGRAALDGSATRWLRALPWLAVLLLALYARHWIDALAAAPVLAMAAQLLLLAVPMAAGMVLLALSRNAWAFKPVQEPAAHQS